MGKINTVQISGISYSIEDSEATKAVSGKQDTLISGTNIKTINNESILGSGNIDIQGGGKAVTGGTNISVTTGETADTVSCTLPISRGSGHNNSLILGTSNGNTASGQYSISVGGRNNSSSKYCSLVGGNENQVSNEYETAFGNSNKTNYASTTFGDSGNTIFSVGNGPNYNFRHNAFEIRQDGSIYIPDLSNGTNYRDRPMIKLQDHLGGGGGGIDSGTVQTMIDESISGKADTSAITSSITSASTDSQVPSAKAVYGVATTDEYPIEGVLSAKHFWDDENMGAYTEIGSLNNIKVPNSSLLSNPYISYVFAENEEFMGDTCALVATVTSGSIASVELLNGSSVSSVTATYDNDYIYFTTSASSFSADGLNIVAVMGNDFKPSNVMDLRMEITESAVDCGVISVVGNIPSEPTKDSIKRIYDGLNEFEHVNPIADTITLDNGNDYGGGRDNTLIGYGVLNYNTYNPITNTTTSGNTADVFKYNVIDFKGDNNVFKFNKTIIDKSTFSSITPQFAISSFTDGDTSSYNDELFGLTTCMIVETNPNASGGMGMGDEINISISSPNNIEGGISFQLRHSILEANVTYNNKTVNKVLSSFANGNSLLIDLRDYWGDTYGTHTFTVENWRGSNMLTKISFYTSVGDRNKLHLEDAVEMLMDKETITLDELDDKLIDYASIESVNIYEYGNPSAVTVTVSTSSLHGTFYGFSVSGVSSGVSVQWYISDGQVSRPYSMTNGVIDNNNDSTFDHCINKELTNYENGVVNVFLNTSDAYISRIYASSEPYQGTVYQSITVTPIKDALSGKVDTSAITSSVTSASTDSEVPTAKAVYDQLGGLKLVKLTQSAYDALSPNYDSNTLYVIVN